MLKLATFHTTTGAMGFERLLKDLGQSYTLKPIPRNISAGCGIAVEFTCYNLKVDTIHDLDKIYLVENGTYSPIDYTEIRA